MLHIWGAPATRMSYPLYTQWTMAFLDASRFRMLVWIVLHKLLLPCQMMFKLM